MAITSAEQTAIIKTVSALFNKTFTPETTTKFFNFYENNGKSLAALADGLIGSNSYQALYAGAGTMEEFGAILMNKYNMTYGGTSAADVKMTNFIKYSFEHAADNNSLRTIQAVEKFIVATLLPSVTAGNVFETMNKVIANKAEVAIDFKNNPANAGKEYNLSSVTDNAATVTAAKENTNTGTSYALTVGLDEKSGSEFNDIFSSDFDVINKKVTLTALDLIDGNGGIDTLKITSDNENNPYAMANATIREVEKITIEGSDDVLANVAGSNVTGLETISVLKSVDAEVHANSTTDVNVSNASGNITVVGGENVVVNDANTNKAITVGNEAAAGDAAGTITITDTDNSGAANTIKVEGGTDVTVTTTATATSGEITVGDAVKGMATGNVVVTQNTTSNGTAAIAGNVTVTGGKTVEITANMTNTAVKSGGTGSITAGAYTVIADNTTTDVTVVQNAIANDFANDAAAVVKETSVVTFKDMKVGETLIVNGLTFTASKALTATEVAAAFANLTSADTQSATGVTANGIYTGTFNTAAWTSAAANGATVTFTAIDQEEDDLVFTGTAAINDTAARIPTQEKTAGTAAGASTAVNVTEDFGIVLIDDNATKSITTVTVDGYAGSSKIGNTSATTLLSSLTLKNAGANVVMVVVDTADTLALSLEDMGTSTNNDEAVVSFTAAPKTLNITNTGDNYVDLTANATETLSVEGSGLLNVADTDLVALKALTVSGSASLVLSGLESNTLTSVVTTTTGSVTASIDGTDATYTGGAGVDNVTLVTETALTKAIDLGAGDDTLTFNTAVTGSTAALSGGTGTDTLSMTVANAAALDATAQTFYTNFERLTINNIFGTVDVVADTETINLANLGFTSYVTTTGTQVNGVNGATATDILTLDKLSANATVSLTANGSITAVLADATGTSDIINVLLSNEIGTAGTFTAAGVETINVTTTDIFTDTNKNDKDDSNSTATLALTTAAAKTISVTGAGDLTLTTTSTVLTTIDASTMTGALTYNATVNGVTVNAGSGADMLTVTADNLKINAGAGDDSIAIAAGADLAVIDGGAGKDTFNFTGVSTNKSNYAVIKSVDSGDVIDVNGVTGFVASEITLSQGATESTQAYLDQAMTTLTAGQMGWFQYNGNTFIAADAGAESANSFSDGNDFVVMINGLVDLGTGASFNTTTGTLEIA